MNETRLRTVAQLKEFLNSTPEVEFSAPVGDDDTQRYGP